MCGHAWERMSLGQAALAYASMGLAVLPLQRGEKRPHKMLGPTGGVHHASTDQGWLARRWGQDPDANIGIACGSASGLMVVDLDVKHGHDGPGAFSAYLRTAGFLPPGGVAETPSGGYHLWHRAPPLPTRTSILPGVDIKADGGYVAAAPSRLAVQASGHDGERPGEVMVSYRWQARNCACTAPWAPAWLDWWVRNAAATGSGSRQNGGPAPDTAGMERNGIPRGERNSTMHRTACSLFRRFGTTPAGMAEVSRKLREIWEHTDHRDYPWEEVLISAESARKFIDRRRAAEDADAASSASWLRRHGG